jgi:hypothetical protein
MPQFFDNEAAVERVILVGVATPDDNVKIDASLDELEALAQTAGAVAAGGCGFGICAAGSDVAAAGAGLAGAGVDIAAVIWTVASAGLFIRNAIFIRANSMWSRGLTLALYPDSQLVVMPRPS